MRTISALSGALLVSVIASQAVLASGYAIRESSAALLGQSFAGSGSADNDLSTIHYNPATLAFVNGSEVSVSGTWIDPTIKVSDAQGVGPAPANQPVNGVSSDNNVGMKGIIPAGYFGWNWTDHVNVGVAITTPWALGTNYNDNWNGQLYALKSEIESTNINPMVSYRFNNNLSVAAGVQAQYIDATLTNQVWLPFGGGPATSQTAVHNKITGSDWGYGYNVGLLYEFSEQTRLGLAYQSAIHHTLKGDAIGVSNSTPSPSDNLALGAALTGPVSANLITPESVNLSLSHGFNKKWTGHAGVQWTRWNRFSELDITVENPNVPGGELLETMNLNWSNSFYYALGADYQLTPEWVLRAGIAYDESPVDDSHRTPGIPDGNRTSLSLGAGYNFLPGARVDIGYSHLFVEDVAVNLDAANAPSGSLSADYKSHVDIIGVGLSWSF